jgi:hypothetical protein
MDGMVIDRRARWFPRSSAAVCLVTPRGQDLGEVPVVPSPARSERACSWRIVAASTSDRSSAAGGSSVRWGAHLKVL